MVTSAFRPTWTTSDDADLDTALQHLQAQLRKVRAALQTINSELAELVGRTCTGTAYYRDGDKLYANHGEACPLHGEAEPGKRLRTYVGIDPDKIKAVLDAQAAHKRLLQLRRQRERLTRALRDALNTIEEVTDALTNAVRSEPGDARSGGRGE